jgi:hypothetical protein
MLRVPDTEALVDEIANELDTWPGVRIEHTEPDDLASVRYEQVELGVLDRARGVAELRVSVAEHEELIEHGEAEPAGDAQPRTVTHAIEGPSDVTAVLELFDRRYRDVRGEDEPYSSQDGA